MRKVICGCIALAVVGALSAYLLADYGLRHPETLLGRCVTTAGRAGTALNPVVVLGRIVNPPHAPVGCERAELPHQFAPPPAADDPADEPQAEHADEPAAEPMEVIDVEAGPVAPVTIEPAHEGEPEACEDHEAVADPHPQTNEPVFFGGLTEESEIAEPGPLLPYHMPYADEEVPADKPSCCCDWLEDLLHSLTEGLGAAEEQETPAAAEPAQEEPVGETGTYHEHGCPYSGCPYSGCPGYYTPPVYTPTDDHAAPPMKKIKKMKKRIPAKPDESQSKRHLFLEEEGTEATGTTGLDTMEYRPSDGDPHAFDHLPF